MTTITVNASEKYDVHIGGGAILSVASLIQPLCTSKRVAVITDDIVDALYARRLCDDLAENGFFVDKYVFPNGERSKNMRTLTDILEFLAEKDFRRNDNLIALGGGVVGDITGFAASVYMRGIGFIQLPTTLLAAVDASVGGKTAVDLNAGKNLAGSFLQPKAVVCDVDIIGSLPDGIFADGMAEVIKHGVINGEDILRCIETDREKSMLKWLLARNVDIKREVVEKDEHENGLRQILNFGHTVAHAIERASNYSVPHGTAVGTGMVYETHIAEKLGLCDKALPDRIFACCEKYGLFLPQAINEELVLLMKHDKKNKDSGIVFALPEKIGKMTTVKLGADEVLSLLHG